MGIYYKWHVDPCDLQGFNAHTEMKHFDSSESTLDENNPLQQDDWKKSSVDILVPTQECNPDGNGRQFTVEWLFHWPLTSIIHAVVSQSEVLGWFYNPNTTPKDKERVVVCLRRTGQELH